MLIPPQFLAIGGGLALLAGFLGGWTVRDWKADAAAFHAVEKADKLRDKLQGKVDGKSAEYEALLADHNQASTATQTTLREIYHDIKVPADCAVPDAAAGVLDSAIARANAEAGGQPGPALPAAGPAPEPADRP